MMMYAQFTELNEWENENWHFWIPIDGNEEELQKLLRLLTAADPDSDTYSLKLTPVPEQIVDWLTEKLADDTAYMPSHNKLTGKLTVPDYDPGLVDFGEDDPFYKGGIEKFMEPLSDSDSDGN